MVIDARKVEFLNNKGSLKCLAVFLYLKGLYDNSCIYNYNIHSLSIKSGLSRTAIRKYMCFFHSNGWVILRDGNLVFKRAGSAVLRGCPAGRGFSFKIDTKKKTVKSILTALRAVILKKKEKSFAFINNIACDYLQSSNLKKVKKAMRFLRSLDKDLKLQRCESKGVRMGVKKIGSLLNCSGSYASKIMKDIEGLGMVKVKRERVSLGKVYLGREMPPGYYRSKWGFAVKVSCNEYSFL